MTDPGDEVPEPAPTLRELLPRHLPQLESYVRRHMSQTLRDRESATDLVNSVCGDLLASGVEFVYRGEPQLQAWLRTVVANKVCERLRYFGAGKRRSGAGEPGPVDEEPAAVDARTPSQDAMLHEDLSLLDRGLATLPEHYRELIVRVHLHGEPHAQVAADRGQSVAATRNMLTRALVKLAGAMDRLQGGG